jgi:class 3 adenylate cyclase/HAMP domain-containing protein
MYYEAMDTKRTYRGDFRDVAGEWIVLAIPIKDENDNVVAVMETGITKTALEYMVAENTGRIRYMILGVMAILILLLSVILLRSLAPLRELKDRVQEIIQGKLGVQTKVRGRDEVAEIGQAFNQMSSSIEYHVNELTSLNDGYFRFVPSVLFQILRKSSVTDVRLGDQTSGKISILSFNAVDFDHMARELTGEQMFGLINRLFSNLVPKVNENGGVVDRFVDAGLVAFYTNGSEQALKTAVSVCQTLDLANAGHVFGPGRGIEVTNGISHGPVMIGIVGHEQRLAATTVSEYTNLSDFLRRIGPKYSSRIVTTASVIGNIDDFGQKFNARFIGFLYIQASGTTEKMYDVFDGDKEEVKLFKSQTKELFEKGVNLYCAKEFYEARLVFIEVLKRFRDDGAAKEYLYRCDQYYQMENTDGIPAAIEVY